MMRRAGPLGEKKKLPQRKLNLLGEINNHTVIANTSNRLARLKSSLQLAKSIDEVKRLGNEEKALKNQRAHEEMMPVAGAGLARLRGGTGTPQLTVMQPATDTTEVLVCACWQRRGTHPHPHAGATQDGQAVNFNPRARGCRRRGPPAKGPP